MLIQMRKTFVLLWNTREDIFLKPLYWKRYRNSIKTFKLQKVHKEPKINSMSYKAIVSLRKTCFNECFGWMDFQWRIRNLWGYIKNTLKSYGFGTTWQFKLFIFLDIELLIFLWRHHPMPLSVPSKIIPLKEEPKWLFEFCETASNGKLCFCSRWTDSCWRQTPVPYSP